uniref:Uncharacterized protein n=1 Tax=Arion vulgaris TaxID=1028688 RepID=A0A0B7B1T6_9EUPU
MKLFAHLIRMQPNCTVYSLLQENIRKESERQTTYKMIRWHSRILSKSKSKYHPSHQNSTRQKQKTMTLGNNPVTV